MSELLSAARYSEAQHFDNNKQLALQAEKLLDPVDPELGYLAVSAAKYMLSDDIEIMLEKTSLWSDCPDEQEITITVRYPFEGVGRTIEEYTLFPEYVRKHGKRYSARSNILLEARGMAYTIPVLGSYAISGLCFDKPSGLINRREFRRQKQALAQALRVEMDDERTDRLSELLQECNTATRIEYNED